MYNRLIGGHEGAGYIVAMNDDQTDLKVGQNVGIKWIAHSCNVSIALLVSPPCFLANKRWSSYFPLGACRNASSADKDTNLCASPLSAPDTPSMDPSSSSPSHTPPSSRLFPMDSHSMMPHQSCALVSPSTRPLRSQVSRLVNGSSSQVLVVVLVTWLFNMLTPCKLTHC